MKVRFIVAAAIGILVAVLPFVVEPILGNDMRQRLKLLAIPGIAAMMLIWGPHGSPESEALALAIIISVNVVVYGLIALGILKLGQRAVRR